MSETAPERDQQQKAAEFEHQARKKQAGLFGELAFFLLHTKKWWLTPIIVVLLLLGALIALGGTGAAPFIYALF